jgi:hypothetical protein
MKKTASDKKKKLLVSATMIRSLDTTDLQQAAGGMTCPVSTRSTMCITTG